ncbi:hypothetical protein Tco_0720222 [Tanacetum coccineum]
MIQPEPEGSTQGYLLVSVEVLRCCSALRRSGNERNRILKDGDEVTKCYKLKNIKKDATVKLSKSTKSRLVEKVSPEVTMLPLDGKIIKMAMRLRLVDDLKMLKITFYHTNQDKGTSSSQVNVPLSYSQRIIRTMKFTVLKTKVVA